jgi:hypothetical protein
MSGQPQGELIDPDVLLPLQQALKLLPNVRPAAARNQLGEAMYFACRTPSGSTRIGGVDVSSVELAELFIYNSTPTPRLSPRGAALLLHLYSADAFELKDPRLGKGRPEQLERYAASTPSQLVPWRRPARPPKGGRDAAVQSQQVNPPVGEAPTSE